MKEMVLEQYQCRRCGRFWYIEKGDKSDFDMDYGCPYGCDDNGRHTRTITVRVMKDNPQRVDNIDYRRCTIDNLSLIFSIISEHLENPNGEFDEETDIVDAVERVIEWLEEGQGDER